LFKVKGWRIPHEEDAFSPSPCYFFLLHMPSFGQGLQLHFFHYLTLPPRYPFLHSSEAKEISPLLVVGLCITTAVYIKSFRQFTSQPWGPPFVPLIQLPCPATAPPPLVPPLAPPLSVRPPPPPPPPPPLPHPQYFARSPFCRSRLIHTLRKPFVTIDDLKLKCGSPPLTFPQ